MTTPPDKWFIKVVPNSDEAKAVVGYINNFIYPSGSHAYKGTSDYYYFDKINKTAFSSTSDEGLDYTEITFPQFKEWYLDEPREYKEYGRTADNYEVKSIPSDIDVFDFHRENIAEFLAYLNRLFIVESEKLENRKITGSADKINTDSLRKIICPTANFLKHPINMGSEYHKKAIERITPEEREAAIKEMERVSAQNQAFIDATEPLMKYLADNHNPHVKVIVTSVMVEIVSGEFVHNTDKFLK